VFPNKAKKSQKQKNAFLKLQKDLNKQKSPYLERTKNISKK
jgi:hypothetical protein